MVAWEKIEEKLGTWAQDFKKFYDSGGFEEIYSKLKKEKEKVVPNSKDLFKAFSECPKGELKTVWVGLSPYYMLKNEEPVADGLAFSCGHTKIEQPSLKLIFDAIEDDLYDGLTLEKYREPNLGYLASQGVLLLNAMLTTTEGKADAHKELWRPFIEYFFREVLTGFSGIICTFFGKVAQDYSILVDQNMNHVIEVEHPSFANRQTRPFRHQNLFKETNKILKQSNGLEISWLDTLPF